MAFIPTAGAVRTDIQFAHQGQQVHNIIWASRDQAWTQAEREALNAAISSWWSTSAKAYFEPHMLLQMITSVNQDTQSSPSSTLVVTPAVAGTMGAQGLTTGVSLCATLRTDLRGRNFRGRMYLGGIPSGAFGDATTAVLSHVTNLLTALTALKTAITALGAVWVVVSKYTNKIPRAQGLKTPITAISMDQYWDSQRRRLGLRGV